jgi:ribose-phosphate pyrophosphokinase
VTSPVSLAARRDGSQRQDAPRSQEAAVYADRFEIYTGNANPQLARKICAYLGVELGRAEVFQFANENIFVRILDNVRAKDVFLIQPTCRPVNQSIMELLIMIDAFKRASAGRITAVVPYYAYGRSDKKDQPRVPITARLIADMITVAGADRLLTMDLHQGQIQGFFNIPVDELTAVHILSAYFKNKALENLVVVTDLGFAKRARTFAELLNAPLAIIEKRRVGNLDRAELLNVIGDVRGKRAVVVDDEIDTAGTLMETVRALEREGVKEIYACATHGVLSGPAVQRIRDSSLLEVVLTDTIPLPPASRIPQITQLSVAPLFGEAIRRIHRGESVGALFTSEVSFTQQMLMWEETVGPEAFLHPATSPRPISPAPAAAGAPDPPLTDPADPPTAEPADPPTAEPADPPAADPVPHLARWPDPPLSPADLPPPADESDEERA